MMRSSVRAVLVLALACGLVQAAHAGGHGRIEIPIRQTVLTDGTIRYSVPVSIGGSEPIDAMLDTGSFGLRVLASALAPDRYRATDAERRYPYGSGAVLRGPIAMAEVAMGGASTDGPIGIQVVRSVGCTEDRPKCPVSKIPSSQYGIGGDGLAGQGFKAILGTSLRRAPTETAANNPLADLVSSSWVVMLPRPGDAEPGRLILDPAPDEVAGYTPFQLEPQAERNGGQPGWADARLPGCLTEGDAKPMCAPTLLDTGAPGVAALVKDMAARESTRPGLPARISFSAAGSTVTAAFVTGDDPATDVRVGPPRRDFGPRIMAGSVPFYTLSVLYDARQGIIALKPR